MTETLSYQETINLCRDLYLINDWCSRKNGIHCTKDYLVGLTELNQWIEFFNQCKSYDVCTIGYSDDKQQIKTINSDCFTRIHPLVIDILTIGKGKISLCGGAIISILSEEHINDYDLFFHIDTVDEAEDLFNQCLNHIINSGQEHLKYSRSKHCFTIQNYDFNIQFIKRFYQNRNQVLTGFDLFCSQLGYNIKDGFFATIAGAMSYAMNIFLPNLDKYHSSYDHRIYKYIYWKNYWMLLPGLPNDLNDEKVTVGNLDLTHYSDAEKEGNKCYWMRRIDNNDQEYDYSGYLVSNCNLMIKNKCDNVCFISRKLSNVMELPDHFVEKQMRKHGLKVVPNEELTKKEAMEFFGDNYKDFAVAFYVEDDQEKAMVIWEQRAQYFIDLAKQHAQNIKRNKWIYLGLGSRDYGQTNPIRITAQEWYGTHYQPIIVGIDYDRFQMALRAFVTLPDDVISVICEYWLQYEVETAKQRLLSLKI